MKIYRAITKFPGGLMVIPLLLGAAFNTFWPQALEIGGFTTALFKNGALPLIGAFLFCMGAGIDFKLAPRSILQGTAITATKFGMAVVFGVAVGRLFPGGFLGLSALAIIGAMENTNGGLYAALTGQFGTETDVGAISVISINDGPFLTMVAMGAAGLANIPFMALVAVIIPIILGMIIGNLDDEMRQFLVKGAPVLIPLFSFPLGAGLNFRTIFAAGLPGLLLGLMVVGITGAACIIADRLAGGSGVAGAAAASTAGNAAGTPMAVAMADPAIAGIAAVATAQIATSVIVTALLVPLLVTWVAKRNAARSAAAQVAPSVA
ncbi:MAG: 2-keto-3-deoxygluconate permease [Spirochaetaceae bacterium]|nr:MAG: 2-keto-3-deoxygluconate permease [Spirochaetaceae bacterium]